jgi:hypothetical protein
VRATAGGEARLPSIEHFRAGDQVPVRVLNQILLGVSTRGYEKSLGPAPLATAARGASKSAASRHLVARMAAKMRSFLSRRLEELDLLGADARWTSDCAPHSGGSARHLERRPYGGAGTVAGFD